MVAGGGPPPSRLRTLSELSRIVSAIRVVERHRPSKYPGISHVR